MAVDKSQSRVRQMFGEIAPRYDLLNHLLSLNIDRYWRWQAVRLAPATDEQPILDVCTGTADLALAYHSRTAGRVPVFATDFCPEMLEIADRKKRLRGASQLTLLVADTEALPFADDTFQVVAVAFGLRNVSNTSQGLQEMVRVCRPGGRVVILEFSLPQRQPLRSLYGWYFRQVLPKIGQWLARNRQEAYHYLPASVGEFPAGEALVQQMQSAGLEALACRKLTFGIATLYVGTKQRLPETRAAHSHQQREGQPA
jgi:demethylmenaquinone methyltransferase/2-methoxy-6-polyprenyl-1,4-benzoquinol methylase